MHWTRGGEKMKSKDSPGLGGICRLRRALQKISFCWVTPYFNDKILFEKKMISELQGEYLDEYIKRPSCRSERQLDSGTVRSENLLGRIIWERWRAVLGVVFLKLGNILVSFVFSGYLSSFMKSRTPGEHAVLGLKTILAYLVRLVFESQNRFQSGRLALGIETFLLRLSYSRLVFSFSQHRERKSSREEERESNALSNIMNIVLADCSSLPSLILSTLDLLMFPVRFLLTWILLREQVGSVATCAVLTFLTVFSLGFLLQVIGSLFKVPFMRYRDIRISKTHKMLREISQIRLLGREDLVRSKIFDVRGRETFYNRLRLVLIQVGTFLDYHVQTISQLVLFVSYISKAMADGKSLQSGSLRDLGPTGITVLNIFFTVSSIRGLPSNLIEGFISLRRFQEFLSKTEAGAAGPSLSLNQNGFPEGDVVIDFRGAGTAEPADKDEETRLFVGGEDAGPTDFDLHRLFRDLSMQIRRGEKVFLIGESGSGKTTFIREILLNEALMFGSKCKLKHFYYNYHLLNKLPIGYVSQIPWIPSGTIRSIILFGSEYNESSYKRIIECCNLVTDFEQWKEGDLKQIDEGGGILSKGQKTRICIARALYHFFSNPEPSGGANNWSPLFVFDDIFSNLDQFVANKLFYNLFNSKGMLSNSSVLITIDQKSLSAFLKYSSILDPSSSFSLYRYICIENFNYSNKKSFVVPQQVLINHVESIFTDTRIGTLVGSHHMMFSPKSTSCHNPFSSLSLPSSGPGHSPEVSRQNTQSDHSISRSSHQFIINSAKEKVTNKGYISLSSYIWYLSNAGKPFIVVLLLVSVSKSILERFSEILLTGDSTHTKTIKKFLLLYSLSTGLSLTLGGLSFLLEAIACTFGANEIHRRIFDVLLIKVPNAIPIHIMLNRIGGDMLIIDTCIVKSIFSCLAPVLTILGQTAYIVYTFPYFTPCFLVWILLIARKICFRFVSSYREYQRFSISLFSSICGIFSGTQLGGSTIAMLRKQETLKRQAGESIDLYIKVKCVQLASTQWAGFWMNMAMTPVGIILNMLLIQFGHKSRSSSAIICIYYFLSIAEFISSLMYKFVQLEKEMCSVERIKSYVETFTRLNECLLDRDRDEALAESQSPLLDSVSLFASTAGDADGVFPSSRSLRGVQDGRDTAGLTITDLQVSTLASFSVRRGKEPPAYNLKFETLLSIHGTLRAFPGNVIGIIGRTGSGKSSLVNSIMGLHLQTRGVILLNSVDTRTITEKNRVIGLLPQESFLMEGTTIRSLLDPLHEHTDHLILQALAKARLADFVQILPLKLDTVIVSQESSGPNAEHVGNRLVSAPVTGATVKLSTSQIRYLSFVQFTILPLKYQLLLLDEPPYNVTFSYNDVTFETPSIHSIIHSTFGHCPSLVVTHNMDIFSNCNIFWIIKNKKLNKVIQKQLGDVSNFIWNELV